MTAVMTVDGREVGEVLVADSFLLRLRGMLMRTELPNALVLSPCTSVHGAGMRVPLDYAVLDDAGVVLSVGLLRPWGLTRPVRGGRHVLESRAGGFAEWGLSVGSRIAIPGLLPGA